MPNIHTQKVRAFLKDEFIGGAMALLAYCDALEEGPCDYGFEFVSEGGGCVAGEGDREVYYVFRYPQEKLPESYTARIYIFAPDDGNTCFDSEIVGYNAIIYDPTERERTYAVIADSSDAAPAANAHLFDTVAECVAWINEQIGGLTPIIKKEDA